MWQGLVVFDSGILEALGWHDVRSPVCSFERCPDFSAKALTAMRAEIASINGGVPR